MDEATQLLCDALQVIEDSVGASINWAGADYPCSSGPDLLGKLLGAGGYTPTGDTTVVVRTALFDEEQGSPQEKQTLSLKSAAGEIAQRLRIRNLMKFRGAFLVLSCVSPNQGS